MTIFNINIIHKKSLRTTEYAFKVNLSRLIVNFIILLYQRFSAASFESPADSANFGLVRSSPLCKSAFSVTHKACRAKRKCSPTDCPSNRELVKYRLNLNYRVINCLAFII
jgi:hypothetical protein